MTGRPLHPFDMPTNGFGGTAPPNLSPTQQVQLLERLENLEHRLRAQTESVAPDPYRYNSGPTVSQNQMPGYSANTNSYLRPPSANEVSFGPHGYNPTYPVTYNQMPSHLENADPHAEELKRVQDATTSGKRFLRTFGIGKSTSGIIKDAISSPHASVESISKALEEKRKVSHRRYEIAYAIARPVQHQLFYISDTIKMSKRDHLDAKTASELYPTSHEWVTNKLRKLAARNTAATALKAADYAPENRHLVEQALLASGSERQARSENQFHRDYAHLDNRSRHPGVGR